MTVVIKYDEQSAVPGLVGKLLALTAEMRELNQVTHRRVGFLPRRQLSALQAVVLAGGAEAAAAAPTRPQIVAKAEKRMMVLRGESVWQDKNEQSGKEAVYDAGAGKGKEGLFIGHRCVFYALPFHGQDVPCPKLKPNGETVDSWQLSNESYRSTRRGLGELKAERSR